MYFGAIYLDGVLINKNDADGVDYVSTYNKNNWYMSGDYMCPALIMRIAPGTVTCYISGFVYECLTVGNDIVVKRVYAS